MFESPKVSRIISEPTTATFITLQAEVCDNAYDKRVGDQSFLYTGLLLELMIGDV